MKKRDITKMDAKEQAKVLRELRFEIVRARASPQKANRRTKDIKKAIARLLTFAHVEKTRTMRQQ